METRDYAQKTRAILTRQSGDQIVFGTFYVIGDRKILFDIGKMKLGDEKTKSFTFDFAKLDLRGNYKLRDVWRQKDVGTFTDSFRTDIRHHGVVLLRMLPKKQPKTSQKHD